MRIAFFLLAAAAFAVLAGCTTTTVTTRPVGETEMKEGESKIIEAGEAGEKEGVTSKPVEPEKPENGEPKKEDGPDHGWKVPDSEMENVKKQESEPGFKPTRTAQEVNKSEAEKLLEEMKKELEAEKAEREKKVEEMAAQLRNSVTSKDNTEEAAKKFSEAEKLYSEKKLEEAAAGYRKVLDLVPTHREALERLTQCYADIEKTGGKTRIIKKPATIEEITLVEQKYASAVRLYDEGNADEAAKKFKEVVEMIEWSPKEIDRKGLLEKAREFVDRIQIEKELESKPAPPENNKKEEKKGPEKPGTEKPEEKKPDKPKDVGKENGKKPPPAVAPF